MSTLKADAVTTKSDNTDLTITGGGSGVPNLEAGFKVGGTAGVPVTELRTGTDGELITWDASGDPAVVAVGTATHVLTSNGAGAAPPFQAVAAGGPTLGTIQTPTGDAATFTGIPSGTKRININMNGISHTGTDYLRLRLGDAGGIELGGYLGFVAEVDSSDTRTNSHYNDFELDVFSAATDKLFGTVFLTLMDAVTFQWACSFVLGRDPGNAVIIGGGSKSLSAELTQLELKPSAGSSPVFDDGTINIAYD